MKKAVFYLFALSFISSCQNTPSLKGTYTFDFITKPSGEVLLEVTSKDTLFIGEKSFQYYLLEKGDLFAKGDYHLSNDTLIFDYEAPQDTSRKYWIKTLNDNALVIQENEVLFGFKRKK